MKKNRILATFAIMLTTMTGLAQTHVTIHSQNTEPTSIDAYDIEGFVFERVEEAATTEEEWIDLGLTSGVLWRSYNFGAGHPTASGTYIPYSMWKEKERDYIAEICNYQMRAPGSEDIEELFENCTAEKDEIDGVVGVRFTGRNGNSIFLPAAGVHYTDDSELWRNVICAYWAFQHYTSDPINGWSFNADNPAGNLTDLTQESYHFSHPIDRTLDFCLFARPVKDTSTDENVIYDCQEWPSFELENETENTVVFEVVASKKPVISCEDDFVSWEISEGEDVAIPENFDDYFNGNPRTLDGSFRKWTVTFSLLPNDTGNWRETSVTFNGKIMPWGENGSIGVRQAPGV